MAEIKKTKKVYFTEILEIVKGNSDLENFVNHEIELLDKKNLSKAPTKVQIENESIKETILEVLIDSDKKMTISDIQNANEELSSYSNQKISALLTQLVNEKKVERTLEKKKAYFSAV